MSQQVLSDHIKFVKAGLFAQRYLQPPDDCKVILKRNGTKEIVSELYRIIKVGDQIKINKPIKQLEPISDTLIEDTIKISKFKNYDEQWEFGMGYSSVCNILLIVVKD